MVKMKNLIFKKEFLLASIIVILLDQLLKIVIDVTRFTIDWSWLKIHYLTNTGAGFGILQGRTIILGVLSLLVAGGVLYYYKDLPSDRKGQVLWGIFLGGVVGNMLDRFFRGFVIDFIDFGWWPAFNIADIAITVSVVLIVILYWKD
jgi:signal peptidase II